MEKKEIVRKATVSEEDRIKETFLYNIIKKYCVKGGKIKLKEKLGSSAAIVTDSLSKDVELFNNTFGEDCDVRSLSLMIKNDIKDKVSKDGHITISLNPLEIKLSKEELEILKKVYVKYDESHSGVLGYYKSRSDAETYRSFIITSGFDKVIISLSSIFDYETRKTAYESIADEYSKMVKKLGDSGNVKPTTIWKGYTFYDDEKETAECHVPEFSMWLEDSLKRLLINNKNRLDGQICAISTDRNVKASNYYDEEKSIYEMDTPEWDDWCEVFTLDEKNTVMAWLYSVVDYKHKGRQCLWFCDEGYTGKSRFFDALSTFFNDHGKNNIVRVIGKGVMDSQFATAGLIGARLIIYPDCKNMSLVRQEKIHNIASNDTMSIEAKFQTPYSAKLHARVIVASNDPPSINTSLNNEKTRIIYIRLKTPSKRVLSKFNKVDKDGNLLRRSDGSLIPIGYDLSAALLKEMPGILYKSRQIYKKLCPKGEEIVLPTSVYESMINNLSSPDQIANELFISEYLKVSGDESDYIIAGELKRLFETEASKDSLQLASLIRILEGRGIQHKRKAFSDGSKPKIYTGVRLLNAVEIEEMKNARIDARKGISDE